MFAYQNDFFILGVASLLLVVIALYRLQKFADTDRLRVNRRPIRKDFFPDRYDFVPIVFTSSSCKRGLSHTAPAARRDCTR